MAARSSFGAYTIISAAHIAAGSPDNNGFSTSGINTSGSNLLVAAVGYFVGGTMTLTDSNSNTWVALSTVTNGTGNNSVTIYYSLNPIVGPGHVFNVFGNTSYVSIAVQGFAGAKSSSVFDAQNGATTVISASLQPGSISPAEDNELIMTAYSQSAIAGTMTIDSGFTITDQVAVGSGNHFGIALAYKILGAGTAGVGVNPTWTNGSGVDQSAASIGSFKAAAGGATPIFGIINNPVLGGL